MAHDGQEDFCVLDDPDFESSIAPPNLIPAAPAEFRRDVPMPAADEECGHPPAPADIGLPAAAGNGGPAPGAATGQPPADRAHAADPAANSPVQATAARAATTALAQATTELAQAVAATDATIASTLGAAVPAATTALAQPAAASAAATASTQAVTAGGVATVPAQATAAAVSARAAAASAAPPARDAAPAIPAGSAQAVAAIAAVTGSAQAVAATVAATGLVHAVVAPAVANPGEVAPVQAVATESTQAAATPAAAKPERVASAPAAATGPAQAAAVPAAAKPAQVAAVPAAAKPAQVAPAPAAAAATQATAIPAAAKPAQVASAPAAAAATQAATVPAAASKPMLAAVPGHPGAPAVPVTAARPASSAFPVAGGRPVLAAVPTAASAPVAVSAPAAAGRPAPAAARRATDNAPSAAVNSAAPAAATPAPAAPADHVNLEFITTREQVLEALRRREDMVKLRLGEVLLAEKMITNGDLAQALRLQSTNPGVHLGQILIQMGVLDEAGMRRALARRLGIPFVHLRKFLLEPVGLSTLHQEFMRKNMIVPLFRIGPRMVVAVENPLATGPLQELAFCTRLRIEAVMAAAEDIEYLIKQATASSDSREQIVELVSELNGQQLPIPDISPETQLAYSDNAIVRLVNMIIMDAYEQGASDIHIESMKDGKPIRIRFRKDGVLSSYSELPANFRDAVVSRIKIMSRLDISEKRHAQDGKVHFDRFGPASIELRVVTIPTVEGLEDVVMRILANRKLVLPHELGLAPDTLSALTNLILKPQGLLFVCGPTGSGKTTTLHALMSHINTPERKIWTVEDPVEISQDGLRQVQVQARIDWTFAAVLRSFMRADPDVIMVGETRDLETARTVLEASLTGHLVLSTMHTNSAVESMVRLLDFGLDPFNFADAVNGVLSQRLVRRLCPSCSRPKSTSPDELSMLAQEYCEANGHDPAKTLEKWREQYGDDAGNLTLHAARGCEHCNGTGYKGRLGVHELLVATPSIKKQISAKVTAADLARSAMGQGMRTLRQDGIEKILQGQTNWEQVRTL